MLLIEFSKNFFRFVKIQQLTYLGVRSLRDLDGGDVEGSYCSRKGLQELIIFEKAQF